jgi:hypothetical protein
MDVPVRRRGGTNYIYFQMDKRQLVHIAFTCTRSNQFRSFVYSFFSTFLQEDVSGLKNHELMVTRQLLQFSHLSHKISNLYITSLSHFLNE